MMRASWLDVDDLRFRAGVVAVVVALHLLFYVVLSHSLGAAPVARASDSVLVVEFIERKARPPVVVPVPTERRRVPQVPRKSPSVAREPPPETFRDVPAAPAAPRPLVMEWKERTDTAEFPLTPAEAETPDPAGTVEPDRFTMRRPLSGEDVIVGTAQFLGTRPPGYTTDPCPRIERNIGSAMTDGSAAGRRALTEELRRRRASCRK